VSAVLTERDGGVLTITFNRPDVLNAFDAEMQNGFRDALKEARDAPVRAVVVTGAGRGFCVGQDLNAFRDEAGDIATRLRTTFNPNVLALRSLEKPVIASVNGPAAGAGMSLACACDLRIAADSASFVPAFIGIGLVPDTGGSWFVAQLLGYPRAFEWLTSGRKLSAAEALEWGLVTEVVPADDLQARTAEVAGRYAAAPTKGLGLTKRLLDRATRSRLEEQLEWEAQLQAAAAASDDFREGVEAFLEKREPRFTGA
jgi:2-(1,2-epoxy-1,2-dihydrophenyl)acetyl-CoA isomerase